jgi:hypothetical protein
VWVCPRRSFEDEVCSKENVGSHQSDYMVPYYGRLVPKFSMIEGPFFEDRYGSRE